MASLVSRTWLDALAGAALLLLVCCATTAPKPQPWWQPSERSLAASCEHDQGSACGELGRALLRPERVRSDHEQGLLLLQRGCAHQENDACLALGRIYVALGVPSTEKRGRALLAQACERASAEACTTLGGISSPAPLAREYFRKGCLLGDLRACEEQGRRELDDPAHGDPLTAERALMLACRGGRISGCHSWGLLGLASEGKRDGSLLLLTQSCEAGYAPSCLAVARAFAPVLGFAADCEKAKAFAARSCPAQPGACAIADACDLTEAPKARGSQGPKAEKRLAKACEEDEEPFACFYLAESRRSRPAEVAGARAAYEKAASRGDAELREVVAARLAELLLAEAKSGDEANLALGMLHGACTRGSREACCSWAEAVDGGPWRQAGTHDVSAARAQACRSGRCCSDARAPTPRPRD